MFVGYDVLLGNGLDELIIMFLVVCVIFGWIILVLELGFVMYGVFVKMVGLDYVGVLLCVDLMLDLFVMLVVIEVYKLVIIWLGYFNNLIGMFYLMVDVLCIIEVVVFYGLVVVDEVY